jgi:hypothetical protein
MPKKRFYKKRSFRRYRRKFSKKRRSHKASNKCLTKFRSQYTITAGTASAIQLTVSLYNPQLSFNNGVSGTIDPSFATYQALYDIGKVCAIKLRWVPFYQAASQSITYSPMYSCTDPDAATGGGIITEASMLQYNSFRVHDMQKPFKIYFKCRKLTQITNSGNTIEQTYPGGYYNILNASVMPDVGVLWLQANGLTSGITYGTFILTYYFKFKDRI